MDEKNIRWKRLFVRFTENQSLKLVENITIVRIWIQRKEVDIVTIQCQGWLAMKQNAPSETAVEVRKKILGPNTYNAYELGNDHFMPWFM